MCAEVHIKLHGREDVISAEKGMRLSEILQMAQPCGGHGTCGKCKVKAQGMLSELTEQEKKQLTAEEISAGMRLACCTTLLGDCNVEKASDGLPDQIVTDGYMPEISLDPIFGQYGAAFDIGTTTLAARLYNPKGELLSAVCRDNPQAVYGADVISRLEHALNGNQEPLAGCICGAMDEMLLEMAKDGNVLCGEIDAMVVTGNTAMLYLLTGKNPQTLSRAPFAADCLFGEACTAQSLGLKSILPHTRVYLPPCISAFVGADMVCAMLAAQIGKDEKPALLVDIGTNGEMGLWDGKVLTVCATAAGPAFEGSNISMGMRGGTGAIDAISWDDGGLKVHVIGQSEAKGLCGSGLVDAVSYMLHAEILDDSGYLEEDPCYLHRQIAITGKDIRMVQLAKGAICAGICVLLNKCALEADAISHMYIAGGFGKYLNMDSAAQIGLFPAALAKKARVIGNGALSGAAMLLLNASYEKAAREIAEKAELLELSANPAFTDLFAENMLLGPV